MFKAFIKQLKSVFKKYFITGFLILVPIGASFSVLKYFLNLADRLVHMKEGKFLFIIPSSYIPDAIKNAPVPGFGLIFLICIILLVGFVGRTYFGRKIHSISDQIIEKIPVIRKIHVAVKQILETVLKDSTGTFGQVVLVEFPRKGIYAIGFVTGIPSKTISDTAGEAIKNVFVPTTPNPTSGFLLLMPEKDLVKLDIDVETAFKLIISGGSISPDSTNNLIASGK